MIGSERELENALKLVQTSERAHNIITDALSNETKLVKLLRQTKTSTMVLSIIKVVLQTSMDKRRKRDFLARCCGRLGKVMKWEYLTQAVKLMEKS